MKTRPITTKEYSLIVEGLIRLEHNALDMLSRPGWSSQAIEAYTNNARDAHALRTLLSKLLPPQITIDTEPML